MALTAWCLQDEAAVSHASKIEKAEGLLDFREGARTLHNKVTNTLPSCSWLQSWGGSMEMQSPKLWRLHLPIRVAGKLCWILGVRVL